MNSRNLYIKPDFLINIIPSVHKSITSKNSIGGTAPNQVMKQINLAKGKLKI